jgi:signal transduction histidine kinase|tara:strand:- start:190 stop:726 length:537 start_codon:yes stop_codon:yes gene_type:complete
LLFTLRAKSELLRSKNEKILIVEKIEAENANEAKSKYLSRISYELKIPLKAIIGFSQLLVRYTKNPLINIQKPDIKTITKAGNYLLEFINKILDLSRIESGKIELSIKEINLKPLIIDVINIAISLTESNHICLTLSEFNDVYVKTNYTKVKQFLLNLLSNAIKYNKKSGSVSISIIK